MTTPDERPGESNTDLLAKLFDLRTFIGALFLIFGVIVTIAGISASRSQHPQGGRHQPLAGARHDSCWCWARSSSGGCCSGPRRSFGRHEMSEDDLPEQMRHHGLEAIPEHRTDEPPEGPRRRRPPAH